MTEKAVPVILCGGAGTRLWPLSTPRRPKHLLKLLSDETLLQTTARRFSDTDAFDAPIAICHQIHGPEVANQLAAKGMMPRSVLMEPIGRNTAPAIVLAAYEAAVRDPATPLVIVPADHDITAPLAFRDALRTAIATAKDGWIVTLGIEPDRASEAFGYIEMGEAMAGSRRVHRIGSFVEKPAESVAKRMLAAGRFAWNAGIFVARADTILAEAERLAPEVAQAARGALGAARRSGSGLVAIDAASFSRAPSLPFDVAIMEHTDRGAVVPVSMGWSDIGSWQAVRARLPRTTEGNALSGPVTEHGVRDSLIWSDGPPVVAVGLDNVAVVATAQGVLVMPLDQAENLKSIVAEVEKRAAE
ncbi:MAG: sugar phosphate nucleotidyltransferase [Azospirillaceae bacterium]